MVLSTYDFLWEMWLLRMYDIFTCFFNIIDRKTKQQVRYQTIEYIKISLADEDDSDATRRYVLQI